MSQEDVEVVRQFFDACNSEGIELILSFTEHGLGQASGVRIEQRPACVCTIRKGRTLRLAEYQTTAEALEAAGLEE